MEAEPLRAGSLEGRIGGKECVRRFVTCINEEERLKHGTANGSFYPKDNALTLFANIRFFG